MISELIYNIGPFEEMKVYMKPPKYASKRIELITREDGTSVLLAGVRTFQEKFKLTKEEIRRIFYGAKGKPSAVEKLSEKTFRFQGKSYTIEKVRLIDAIKEHLYEDDFELLAWRIRLHRVFTSGLEAYIAYIKDNIERIRLLANITHPKAWKSVFTFKNMLMTIRSPIKYSYSTLIKKSGISFRKGHVEDAKETLMKHLKALQEASYIGGIKIIDDQILEILPPQEKSRAMLIKP